MKQAEVRSQASSPVRHTPTPPPLPPDPRDGRLPVNAPRTPVPPGHAVTIRLTPVQMRMLMQVAEDNGTKAAPEIIEHELGEHVAHMLECFHGHDLDAARARWDREAKEAA